MRDVNVSGFYLRCLLISRLRSSRRGLSFRRILFPLSPTSASPRAAWVTHRASFPLATRIRRSPGRSDSWRSQTISQTRSTRSPRIFAHSVIFPCSASHSAGLALISEHCFRSLLTVSPSFPSHCRLLWSAATTADISTAFPPTTRLFMNWPCGILPRRPNRGFNSIRRSSRTRHGCDELSMPAPTPRAAPTLVRLVRVAVA